MLPSFSKPISVACGARRYLSELVRQQQRAHRRADAADQGDIGENLENDLCLWVALRIGAEIGYVVVEGKELSFCSCDNARLS